MEEPRPFPIDQTLGLFSPSLLPSDGQPQVVQLEAWGIVRTHHVVISHLVT